VCSTSYVLLFTSIIITNGEAQPAGSRWMGGGRAADLYALKRGSASQITKAWNESWAMQTTDKCACLVSSAPTPALDLKCNH
jgi:hypothetical protein